jgi:hypothetical protein
MKSRLLLSLALPLGLLLVVAPDARANSNAYPTEGCVKTKLIAAGRYCRAAVLDAALDARPNPSTLREIEKTWASAEARSEAAGVSCVDTTVSAAGMAELLDAAAAEIASAAISTNEAAAAAATCQQILAAEGQHLLGRGNDRLRKLLGNRRAAALAKVDGPVEDAVIEGTDAALRAVLVSPNVSTEWTMITPDASIEYQGKTLEPTCGNGTPWVFFVKRGTVNKTLMYYQGGGACWNYLTCTLPTHKTSTGPGDNPANFQSGFANLNNPDNPFKDWNVVFVPYCTGDVHWGDRVVEHRAGPARSVTIRHKGFTNAQVAEKWAREHFVNPEQVFVTGSSAGSYGAVVNSLPLQETVWPSTDFAVVGDGGNGVITQDFLENDLSKWGIEDNLPAWIPGLNVPLTELTAADLWTESALFYPHNRYATYSTAYDGGSGGQIGFYNIMLNQSNPLLWSNWWPPACEWNSIMRMLNDDTRSQADNFRFYIGSGTRHTMWGNNKVYSDTTGNVPTVRDWLVAMLEETPDWVDVDSDDPGLLLPGDPRAVPVNDPPFNEDGTRVVCEDAAPEE